MTETVDLVVSQSGIAAAAELQAEAVAAALIVAADLKAELQGVPAEVEAHEKPITFAEIFDLLLCQAQHGEAMQAALVREGMLKAPDPRKLREAKVYAAAAKLIERVMDDPAIRARLAEIARTLREAAADQEVKL